MSNAYKDLRLDGILWEASPKADDFGNPRIKPPVPIYCRWELGSQVAADNPIANTHKIVGRVFVDRYIPLQSILARGDISVIQDPDTTLMLVVDYSEVEDVKGRHPRRVVLITAWKDKLPTVI